MQAYEILRDVIKRKKLSGRTISREMGKSDNYLAVILARRNSPLTSTMADLLNIMGCDLIVRDRDSGHEYIVTPHESLERIAKQIE